jgi:hypothetical protein
MYSSQMISQDLARDFFPLRSRQSSRKFEPSIEKTTRCSAVVSCDCRTAEFAVPAINDQANREIGSTANAVGGRRALFGDKMAELRREAFGLTRHR